MRRLVEGLPSPHPIVGFLPGIYLEDRLTRRFTEGLDEVLASLLCTLDNLDAYFDPDLAPSDFLAWLSGWVGLIRDPADSEEARRAMIKQIVEIYRRRGTGHGLRDHIALAFGVIPEIVETGSVTWSRQPRSPMPGLAETELVVQVSVPDPSRFDRAGLDRFVAQNKPAHVPHRIEVLPTEGVTAPPPAQGPPSQPDGSGSTAPTGPDGGGSSPRPGGRIPLPERPPLRRPAPLKSSDE